MKPRHEQRQSHSHSDNQHPCEHHSHRKPPFRITYDIVPGLVYLAV